MTYWNVHTRIKILRALLKAESAFEGHGMKSPVARTDEFSCRGDHLVGCLHGHFPRGVRHFPPTHSPPLAGQR